MFGRRRKPRGRDAEIRALRERLDRAATLRDEGGMVEALLKLEALEPDTARWPHRRGDVLRRVGEKQAAVAAYERAVVRYADAGFLPRAIAMAKVIAEIDPERIDLLEKIDPGAARQLHRRVRPQGVHAGDDAKPTSGADLAQPLEPAPDQEQTEVRFSRVPPRASVEIDISDLELDERASEEERKSLAPEALDDEATEAERLASLPLLPLFAEMPREALARLAAESELVRLADGEPVVRRGDPADALFGIVEGAVRVVVPGLAPDGGPRLAEGDVFGEACLLGTAPRGADVLAEGELTALRIPKATINHLVRVHDSVAAVLFDMLTRRLLSNLLCTSPLFAELDPASRREVAAQFEIRRAVGGTDILVPGKRSDGVYITLTGHVDVTPEQGKSRREGAGALFGHGSLLDPSASELGVRAAETLLVMRLPRESFSALAMQHPGLLAHLSELDPVARVSA